MPKLKTKSKKVKQGAERAGKTGALLAQTLTDEAAQKILGAVFAEQEALPGDYTQAQMAKIVSESSQIADYYRSVATRLGVAIHRALFFLPTEGGVEGDRLMARNALMSIFGYEEPKEWKSHWLYNHGRPSHQAVLDTVNASLLAAAKQGNLAEAIGLPDGFYRYVYEAVCWADSRTPEEETPTEFKYMGVTCKPYSALVPDATQAA